MGTGLKRNRSRGGQALVMATVSLFLMMGVMSLAVDLGWGYLRRDVAQTAADAAASAVIKAAVTSSPSSQSCGSNNVWCGTPAGTATSCPTTAPTSPVTSFDYGCMLAAANGFTPNGSSRTVTIQANTTSPAPAVPGTTVTYWATVKISENATPFFGSPTGGSLLSSTAVSTAAITSPATAVHGPCLYLLATSGAALTVGNGAHVTTSSCGIYVNSSASNAITVIGATITSSSVKVVGGVSLSNGGTISPTPVTGVSAVADPFSSLPSQTAAGSCNSGNFGTWQATPYTPAPGTYCGMNVSNGVSAVLSTGIYIINGGTFSVAGGSTVTASGVMIYLTNGATVSIANGANVTMSAETSGTYEGILFYQDRSLTSPGSSSFSGGATMHLSGSLYFPHASLYFDNGNNAQTEAIIASSIDFQGGATLNQATSQSQTGLVVSTPAVTSIIE